MQLVYRLCALVQQILQAFGVERLEAQGGVGPQQLQAQRGVLAHQLGFGAGAASRRPRHPGSHTPLDFLIGVPLGLWGRGDGPQLHDAGLGLDDWALTHRSLGGQIPVRWRQ
jgi:hypothetical protein